MSTKTVQYTNKFENVDIKTSLLIFGYIHNEQLNLWKYNISIPLVIIQLIKCFYSPFGTKSNINNFEFNITQKIINLIKYPKYYVARKAVDAIYLFIVQFL